MSIADYFSCRTLAAVFMTALLALAGGCSKHSADKALDSDANGYLCLSCNAKFLTDRDTFATRCPTCSKPGVEQVLGFVCAADQHVTINPRGRGGMACEKCGKGTTAVSIPTEAQLKGWGAAKKTAAEVGG